MPSQDVGILSLNGGEVAVEALPRIDVERLRAAAETMSNWLPRVLGGMIARPGTAFIGDTASDNRAWLFSFVRSRSETALLEMTPSTMRIWSAGAVITRASVSSTVPSGDFSASTGWTLTATSPAAATISGNHLRLTGANGQRATAEATVTVAAGDQNVRHALRIVVNRGPVLFRCGSTGGDDDYIAETSLDEGTHSLALTPTGDFHLWFANDLLTLKLVTSVEVEASGAMTLPTPWGANDLPNVRMQQSADVLFCACEGIQQRRIERRDTDSWSVVLYKADDGPFTINTGATTLTPSVLNGNGTLTANNPIFKSGHVGAIFRLFHSGQAVQDDLSAEATFTDAVRVTGVTPGTKRASDDQRVITVKISGTWSGTITLESSTESATTGFAAADEAGASGATTFTANGTYTFSDGLSNSIVWYRAGFETGDYSSGTADVQINFASGGGSGICRVTGFTSSTEVNVEVLDPSTDLSGFKNTTATDQWYEGTWSDVKGWPTAVALHEGRLWWAGNDRIWGSVSDEFNSFNIDTVGDSGPIDRSIGFGPVAVINYLLSLEQLVLGADTSEIVAKSSSFDEPLTPTAFALREISTQGSAACQAVKVDSRGIFAQGGDARVYEIAFDGALMNYMTDDLTRLNPTMCSAGIVSFAVQRQPTTRIWFVLDDGTMAVLTYEVADKVVAWTPVTLTGGTVQSVCVLPNTSAEDDVYVEVLRTIDGSAKHYIEKFAYESEAVGGNVNKRADCHIVHTGSSISSMTGLSALEGETVTVWADGKAQASKTVSSGSITLDAAASNVVVGIGFNSDFKSAKLGYAAANGTPLTMRKRVVHLAPLLVNTAWAGFTFGRDFDHLMNLSQKLAGQTVDADEVFATYDSTGTSFHGNWDTDSRVCIRVASPYPATVTGLVVDMTTNG